ncbi:MAG: sulfatase-like hydrolase/transferase, partial [Verrucomicrobiae bacterium]|nr:sulfatase-like hydrolase/transferase [Verrucomicrobiae bacterium]
YYKDQMIEKNGGPAELVKGYSTDNYTEWALKYIRGEEGRVADKPWYLWLCYGAVHGPYTPAKRHQGEFSAASVETPADIYPPREGKPAYVRDSEIWVPGPNGEPVMKKNPKKSLADAVRQYNEGVLALDEGIGKLMATLRETGQDKNTLVVFTSDQGFGWGQHGFQSKLAPYDATIRSPLIVSFPGRVPEGQVCGQPVGGADLVPTFFAYAGIDLPWDMHGHDLSAWLKDPAKGDGNRRVVLTALTGSSYGKDCDAVPTSEEQAKLFRGNSVPWWVSWREGKYKYIRTLVAGEIEELYDLEADPEELDNLALKSGYRDTVLNYRALVIAELKRTGAKMADALPPVAELPGG